MADVMVTGPAGRLAVRAKGGLERGERPTVILVQGANLSGQTGFDFTFPGGADYSTLDALVAEGFGAVTFAIRGYAGSEITSPPLELDTDGAIEDLRAVVAWVQAQRPGPVHLVGWSWGGRIVGRFTEQHAELVDRLVLLDPAPGGGPPVLPVPTDLWWTNTREDFLKRLRPDFSDADAHAAFADHIVRHEPKAPNGIRMENARGSVPLNPAAITRPTLMIYGSEAGMQNYMQGVASPPQLFAALATNDKALVIIPEAGDYGHLERPRRRFQTAIIAFLRGGRA